MNTVNSFTYTIIHKNLGETPLQSLERFRGEQIARARQASTTEQKSDQKVVTFWQDVPLTYAGRLDPMAEGELLILIGDECKHKEKYLDLDKEYEVEIVFGIETDTYDALGISRLVEATGLDNQSVGFEAASISTQLNSYVGHFTQSYPPYSSKTVNGVQLHELARTDSLPEEMPTKEVEIYDIQVLCIGTISAPDLHDCIANTIGLVKGDFRQAEILEKWHQNLSDSRIFNTVSIRVRCSSGTYMRSLAHKIGQDTGLGAFALSIQRTKILGL